MNAEYLVHAGSLMFSGFNGPQVTVSITMDNGKSDVGELRNFLVHYNTTPTITIL